jgi:hypothetical protein
LDPQQHDCWAAQIAFQWRKSVVTRQQKITLGEMRSSGVRGLLIYCSDYKCSHSIAISADQWPDDARLSDLEPRFICQACGKKGADVRPNFHWKGPPVAAMGYR